MFISLDSIPSRRWYSSQSLPYNKCHSVTFSHINMLEVKRGKRKCELCIFFCLLFFQSFSLFSFLMGEWAGTSTCFFTWGWMLISFLNVDIMDSSSTDFHVSASPQYKIYCYFLLQYFKWHHTILFSWRFKFSGMWCCVVGQVVGHVLKDSAFIIKFTQITIFQNVGDYLPSDTVWYTDLNLQH